MNKMLPTVMLLSVVLAATCDAAEIQLRRQCRAAAGVVRLGDVATVYRASAEEVRSLAAIELMPAPGPGGRRRLDLNDVQQALARRGVNLTRHQFSGASSITVLGSSDVAPTAGDGNQGGGVRFAGGDSSGANQAVADAITGYLRRIDGDVEIAQVSVNLEPRWEAIVNRRAGPMQVMDGPRQPESGSQRFVLSVATRDGEVQVPVAAKLGISQQVVVAGRRLDAGTLVRAADLRVEQTSDARAASRGTARSLDAVVGQETKRTIAEGQPIDTKSLRRPVLVRRRQEVTVFVHSGGILVKTTARAGEEGSLGDLIACESLLERGTTFFARVIGQDQVAIYAGALAAVPQARR